MVILKLFLKFQERFTQDMQPHYVYSPREMTRWVTYSVTWSKGTVSRDGYFFWGSKHFYHYFLRMRWWFSRSFKAFHYPLQLLTFYLLLWNHLLILKMLTETLLRIHFFVIGWCSLVLTSHRLQGKCTRINLSQAASGMIVHNNRRFPGSIFSVKIAAVGSLKWVTGRIFKIS